MSGTEGFTRVQWSCRTHRATGGRYGAGLSGSRHAAWAYNRFHVRTDTQRSSPKHTLNLCFRLENLILARRPGAHLQKSQTQFVCGCWLGRDSHTHEHSVGSKAGVFRTRMVRRLTEERSWSAEAVADMESTTRSRPPMLLLERERNEPICNAPLPAVPSAQQTRTEICCVESEI